MYSNQVIYRELHDTLLSTEKEETFEDTILPWLESTAEEQVWLKEFAYSTGDPWPEALQEDLWQLYALSRVNDLFLLRFQDHAPDYTGYAGPRVTLDQYLHVFWRLGCTSVEAPFFHPFYHEIVSVEQAADDETPIELVAVKWPCLMLGPMLFSRAGVAVRGGRRHIRKEIAETSTLHWTYRRSYRPHQDLSHGWGHNSQWRTSFRRDYLFDDCYLYNVDPVWPPDRVDLNDETRTFDDDTVPGASREERIELLRNRCYIRCELPAFDLHPYNDTYREPR